ncbi:helix-turn-helix domain-containing protein [Streptomyces sp. C1-2]|uniref:helix-turn-helix domain-containing protein n=1 Tax=Streptomyces sp. C1-2 TaxID=2720022 RepID=UPI0014323B91|nr:helix-turn-helix domain-containing protein [Streptomyces sp. C1-2]NJP74564.1 helix-turn-helix domain-containing protein [Streptomyces sp. C1-2]
MTNQFVDDDYHPRITDHDREQVRLLHAEGHSRNEIARRIGRGGRTVTRIAAELGLDFDRARTAAATEAKMIDAKARRAAIIQGLYSVAEDELAYLRQDDEYQLVEVSLGKPVKYTVDRLPAQDRKALVSSISTATSAAARLEALDGDPGVDAARSMLGSLAEGLNKLAGLDGGEDDSGEG